MLASANGNKIRALIDRDTSGHGDDDSTVKDALGPFIAYDAANSTAHFDPAQDAKNKVNPFLEPRAHWKSGLSASSPPETSAYVPCLLAKKRMRKLSHEWLANLRKIVIDSERCPLTFAEFVNKEYLRDDEAGGGAIGNGAVAYSTATIWSRVSKSTKLTCLPYVSSMARTSAFFSSSGRLFALLHSSRIIVLCLRPSFE